MRRPDAVNYFLVLARARQLLPEARALLDHAALVSPDRMSEAARACGRATQWTRFDPDDAAHFTRLLAAMPGELYVVGDSGHPSTLQAIQTSSASLAGDPDTFQTSLDITLIGVDTPQIGLIHHEGVCTVLDCQPAPGPPEDPRELERALARELERRRKEALDRLPPAIRDTVRALLDDGKKIAAMKLLRGELGCSLVRAQEIVGSLRPWWPTDMLR